LVAGEEVKCRIEKDSMFIRGEKGKDVKYRVLGASAIE
jgi:hypothetical protein